MPVAKLDFKLTNYELAAYDLSTIYIKKGYKTDVFKVEKGYATFLYEGGFLKNVLSTPVALKISFIESEDNTTEIEVELANVVYDAAHTIKEVISIITVLPITFKLFRLPIIKKEVKKDALRVSLKYKKEKK